MYFVKFSGKRVNHIVRGRNDLVTVCRTDVYERKTEVCKTCGHATYATYSRPVSTKKPNGRVCKKCINAIDYHINYWTKREKEVMKSAKQAINYGKKQIKELKKEKEKIEKLERSLG